MQTIFFTTLALLFVVFYSYMFFQGRIMRHFYMVDGRKLISSTETYQKLNALMEAGEVSLYSHSFMDEVRVTLSVEYTLNKEETARNRFSTKTMNEAIDQAYAWSVERGYIKE